jgi:hypothetical protein
MTRTWVLCALLGGAAPCIAQEVPVIAPAPVVNAKPVATDNQMLHKYVWSTIGFDGALSATLSSGLDEARSPTEWGAGREGYARRAGFMRRLHHAVDSPFMGRTRTGRRVLSAASLAGNVVPAATWYPAPLGTRDGLKHAGTSLLTQIAVDVFKEFRHKKHTT